MAAVSQQESTQGWFAVWSVVLWVAGLAFFIIGIGVPETASDEVFGYLFMGVILCLPAGLVLGILALRGQSHKHKGKATAGVVLNSITLAAYVILLIIGLTVALE